jgi:hypothetical protein
MARVNTNRQCSYSCLSVPFVASSSSRVFLRFCNEKLVHRELAAIVTKPLTANALLPVASLIVTVR